LKAPDRLAASPKVSGRSQASAKLQMPPATTHHSRIGRAGLVRYSRSIFGFNSSIRNLE
jgi:hypothetical protein